MRMRHQARGSGVSSLVNYLLRVSVVDPLEFDPPLVFERFLGNKRETLPDIDIDVESARRHEAYRAIFHRYGDHRVTLLSMQNRYQARGAVRDAGLALNLPPEQIDMVAKNLWRFQAREFGDVLTEKPELRDVATLIEQHAELQLLVDLTERLDRLPRHISMHPCGVILGNANLMSTTPVQPSGLGLLMSQYDKDDIDDAGLLKLDVLGVRMQSAIAHSIHEIQRIHGPAAAAAGGFPIDAPFIKDDGTVEVDAAPHDDAATFQAIKTTNTLGMFQIESPGQRELGGKLQADDFGEIVIQVAAFRPGPQKTRSAAGYVDAKMFDSPTYLHPTFKPFLLETRGVVIYHEQILKILHTCTGCTLAEADELRRAMEKDLPRVEHLFRTRTPLQLDRNGNRIYTDQDIDRIWEHVSAFGAYGFAKAHAAAFAATTYHSAFLRTHWPAEFFAGLLTHDPGMYAKRLLAGEAQRLGFPLLPLDVNTSSDTYRVEPVPGSPGRGLGIRIALVDVAGITSAELARILAGQPYASIDDFYTRASPSRPLITKLAAVGALDTLTNVDGHPADRGDIIAHVRQLTARRNRPHIHDTSNQLGIVVDDRSTLPTGHGRLEQAEAIATELSILGLATSGHPIDPYRAMLESLGVTPADQLLTLHNKTEVLVAGIRVATQTPPMPSGKRVVFISVDDGSGVIADATFFDEAQDATGPTLFNTRMLIIQGRTRRTGARGISIEATRAWDLRNEWERWKVAHPTNNRLPDDARISGSKHSGGHRSAAIQSTA
jgi:error-prone DNA polymerase